MNVNTPIIYTHVRLSEITQDEQHGLAECRIFGACSLGGRAILFHIQMNNGAVYYRLPVSAFREERFSEPQFPLNLLQPWDCPSEDMEVITYDWLFNQRVQCIKLGDMMGNYVTTFDWSGFGTTAEIAHEHKCAHLIKLDNGQFALQPNNFLLWLEKSNINIDGSHAMLRTNKEYPSVESGG
jgi:hypothetical protein